MSFLWNELLTTVDAKLVLLGCICVFILYVPLLVVGGMPGLTDGVLDRMLRLIDDNSEDGDCVDDWEGVVVLLNGVPFARGDRGTVDMVGIT